MIKLVALYTRPDDVDAFLKHYQAVHDPLVRKTPGLQRFEVSRVVANPMGGEPAYFLMAEMYYRDMSSFRAAMASPENQAVMQDVMGFAAGLLTAMVCDVQE